MCDPPGVSKRAAKRKRRDEKNARDTKKTGGGGGGGAGSGGGGGGGASAGGGGASAAGSGSQNKRAKPDPADAGSGKGNKVDNVEWKTLCDMEKDGTGVPLKTCRFFNAAGCSRGATCKIAHTCAPSAVAHTRGCPRASDCGLCRACMHPPWSIDPLRMTVSTRRRRLTARLGLIDPRILIHSLLLSLLLLPNGNVRSGSRVCTSLGHVRPRHTRPLLQALRSDVGSRPRSSHTSANRVRLFGSLAKSNTLLR